jgi:dTDP-4-dehydrorhamnose 3,5-epimerase
VKVTATRLPEVLVIEPKLFGDERGLFFESWNEKAFAALGVQAKFVQDNQSRSTKNVVRGLHYQIKQSQGKLVRIVSGEVFDVAVDIRRSSPNFGKWVGVRLSAQNRLITWIPPGFAHGFAVLSDHAEFLYKTTDYYAPEHERTVLWNDPDIGIEWPLAREELTVSDRDAAAPRLAEIADELPFRWHP